MFYDAVYRGEKVRAATYLAPCAGQVCSITVAETTRKRDRLVREILIGSVLPQALLAVLTLAIVWFGVEQGSKIAIVTLMTFFPTFISALRGLLAVPPQSLELMRSYAASEWQVFVKLRLPHSLPLLFTALRACTTLAMIGAVVSEFFGGPMKSLGVYIKSTASLFQTRQAWSAILVACALGLAFYFAVALVERLTMPWRVERGTI
jgi:NitT/TauT family transport system permease protein